MTAYRDSREQLRERRDQIFRHLVALELHEDATSTDERVGLVRELDEVAGALRALDRKHLPLASAVRIATPCPAKWESMVGTERVRHCGTCDKEVWNLTALDAEEVEVFLVARAEEKPCIRMYRRPDGHFQDGPCVPGRVRVVRAAAIATALGLVGATALFAALAPEPPRCAVRHDLAPEILDDRSMFMGGMAELAPRARDAEDGAWPPPARLPDGARFR